MKSDAYYIAELEDKILETIFNYMKDIPRPYSLVLSGGFDSGLLAALLKPEFVYSINFPYGPRYDESRYRDAIIKHLDLKNVTIITFTKKEFLPNLREAVKIMEKPVSHFSLAPLNLLMKRVGNGSNVISGEGPDEYLGGYARYIVFDELYKLYTIPELRNYKNIIPQVLGFNNLIERYGEMMQYDASTYYYALIPFMPFLGKLGKMDMEQGVIEIMEQKLAKAHGINLHYPYINPVFAEYCYALPDHLKVRNGITKWAFRQICKKYLPEMMWDRSKMGGPVAPVNHWLRNQSDNEFDKTLYLKKQEEILNEK